jgi:hypothetical protein
MAVPDFALGANIESLIQECFLLHDKHVCVGGGDARPVDPIRINKLAAEASRRLQDMLADLLMFRHTEKTNSNRHQGFGWSTDIIRDRFTASVQKELEGIYASLMHDDTR